MGYEKRREYKIFLEACFGTSVGPRKLEAAGFECECFSTAFAAEHKRQESVRDPRIINHCNNCGYILFTNDKAMRYTHVETIKNTDIGIIAAESFDKFSPIDWIDSFVEAKTVIKRHIKKHPRPWFAHLTIDGKIRKIETITLEMRTRRVRPEEQ